ncbi:MAG TPA: hypothetical protein VGI45_33625 [Terracidiphilus sp.]|jgi:hypothetical protein
MITELLNRFEPDGDVLLRAISAHVTDEMLERISRADYGDRAREHLATLKVLRETGGFPKNMYWVPMEVLELTRWSDPDANIRPGKTAEFGHWIRAFSCAAILRAEHEPWNYKHNDGCTDSTAIQLIFSLEALPIHLNREAARNFAWVLLRSDPEGKEKIQDESVREFGVALLWFALHLDPPAPDDDLISLAQWTSRRADELKWNPALAEFSGLKQMVIRCQERPVWELFGVNLAELDLGGRSPDLQTWVRLIAEQLVD